MPYDRYGNPSAFTDDDLVERRVAEYVSAEEYGLDAHEDTNWSNVEFEPIELPAEEREPGE